MFAIEQKKNNDVPHDVVESLARMLLPEIQRLFASAEGQEAFEHWKNEQHKDEKS